MTYTMPLELWLIIAAFVLLLPFGLVMTIWSLTSRSRRPKTVAEKRFQIIYISALMGAFLGGAITRAIQQSTGSQWLDGFVGVFMGIYVALWGVPFFFWAQQNSNKRVRMLLSCLVGLLPVLSGLIIAGFGISTLLSTML